MISKLSKEGAFRKGLEVFYTLPDMGIAYDTTITNAAISACDKGATPCPNPHPDPFTSSEHLYYQTLVNHILLLELIGWVSSSPKKPVFLPTWHCPQVYVVAESGLRWFSPCHTGNQWQAALEIFRSMPDLGLAADAITYSSVISALAKGKQWAAALQASHPFHHIHPRSPCFCDHFPSMSAGLLLIEGALQCTCLA